MEVDGHLSGCHYQQHQESDGQGELDEALASLVGPFPSGHSWESVPISGEKTRNRIRTSSGRTKKTRAGTVMTTGARVIRSRYSACQPARIEPAKSAIRAELGVP